MRINKTISEVNMDTEQNYDYLFPADALNEKWKKVEKFWSSTESRSKLTEWKK